MNRCLCCYESLEAGDYHERCARQFFGMKMPPDMGFDLADMKELAKKDVISHITVPGVQPKFSMALSRTAKKDRFTIVGVPGNFILKPPSAQYPALPQIEDLTMHLAQIAGIHVVPHCLMRLRSGELVYLTRRIDRNGKEKLPFEDLCQLSGTLTENKYRSSMEKVGTFIERYSSSPGLDKITLFELALFCFLTGNSDMHLKNFSLLYSEMGYSLSPVYDLISVALVFPQDKEEMALPLNGKKSKLTRNDFDAFARSLRLNGKTLTNTYEKFRKCLPQMVAFLHKGFFDAPDSYKMLIMKRAGRLAL